MEEGCNSGVELGFLEEGCNSGVELLFCEDVVSGEEWYLENVREGGGGWCIGDLGCLFWVCVFFVRFGFVRIYLWLLRFWL